MYQETTNMFANFVASKKGLSQLDDDFDGHPGLGVREQDQTKSSRERLVWNDSVSEYNSSVMHQVL